MATLAEEGAHSDCYAAPAIRWFRGWLGAPRRRECADAGPEGFRGNDVTQEGDTVSHRDNAPLAPSSNKWNKNKSGDGMGVSNGMQPHARTHAHTHACTHADRPAHIDSQIRFEIREPVSGVEIEHITYI